MQMRTFLAKDIKTAMQMARDAMGDDVILLNTETKPEGVSVTFALDRTDDEWLEPALSPPPPPPPAPKSAAAPAAAARPRTAPAADIAPAASLEAVLRHHAVPQSVVDHIAGIAASTMRTSYPSLADLTQQLSACLGKAFAFRPLPLDGEGFRLMIVGPPGAGKTITAAKIAARMVVDNRPIRLISTDSKRAAGSDQLQAFAAIMGLEVESVSSPEELEATLAGLPASMRVVIDSASCNPYDFGELKDLGAYASASGIEPVLVCPAGIESGEAEEIAGVFSFLNIERVLISRTDCARRFGSVLAAAHAGGYAYCHMTSSARAMGDFQAASPQLLAGLLTQYQRDRMAA